MAATDKPFRDQLGLDIVFAVSNILMLLSLVWMFWQDYAREYKVEQRDFRAIEVAVAQQQALTQLPDKTTFDKALEKVKVAREYREKHLNELEEARAASLRLMPERERAEAAYQDVKAKVDSITSFVDQAREYNNTELTDKYAKELNGLYKRLGEVQAERDKVLDEIKLEQFKIDDIEGPYTKATAEFKKVNDKLDSQVKLALLKRWTIDDWARTFPVINGFADPLKIQQYTINDIPIDYNFKYVTRYDRCTSCHLGIDRPAFARENLIALTQENPDFKAKLDDAKKLYDIRVGKSESKEGQYQDKDGKWKPVLDPDDIAKVQKADPHDIVRANVKDTLTRSRITEFAAHPRLDLFVGSNSKHPAEKFGCSACHYGQGSGTSFLDASHNPNNSTTRKEWTKERGWEPNHMWDFPMLPNRFIESSCIKCHHEVTDLISSENRVEAPKLLKGYNLIKENGCFGCHEISGWKGANRVGPDLRLEPSPPLEDLLPIERVKAENDPDNRPGTLRKVGPALMRVSEKLSEDWIKKWVRAPRSFRPDTKMPHYFGLSTNDKSVLPEDQQKFPDTEITSIAHFLTKTSKDYLKHAEKQHADDAKNPQAAHQDEMRLTELLNLPRMSTREQEESRAIKARMKYRKEVKLVDLAPGHKSNAETGRVLFTERGCLACHTHGGTELVQGDKFNVPGLTLRSDATFGPNLSEIAAKLVPDGLKHPEQIETARTWLVQWIVDPHVHSPRSRMPVTHLKPAEAADIAAWLLNPGPVLPAGAGWFDVSVADPAKNDLQALAKVYLTRMLSKRDIDVFLKGMTDDELAKFRKDPKDVSDEWRLILNDIADDEKLLVKDDIKSEDSLKLYLGKKGVTRLGCYGCHDIPGFETAKPIGVALNDWGKKPADRLAFEDIHNFFEKKYYPVDSLTDNEGKPLHADKVEDGVKKEPYEKFYADALLDHHPERLGYLNQKIRDPRSYDFNRIRVWDDRSRMPQFAFARHRQKADEERADFDKRIIVEEAHAREAVSTFILGLVAEQVPVKSINQPRRDRLAEVKGRQVLDKFNCAGCHLIRPGTYDFKLGPKTLAKLDFALDAQNTLIDKLGVIRFPNQTNWVGKNPPSADRLTAHGVMPQFRELLNRDEVKEPWLVLTLSQALRYTDDKNVIKNIPSSTPVYIALEDLNLNPASIHSDADLNRRFGPVSQYGGAFSDLLVPYLNKRDKDKYPLSEGDSAEARASLPPVLIGEGERTQPDWLNKFLLDPQPIRKMAILRMPKFNMSKAEADALVAYFAAVSKETNPGVALPFPFEPVPQQDDMDSPYWRKKTAEYVARLKSSKATDIDGKLVKGKNGKEITSFQQRIEEYTPLWEKLAKEQEKSLQAELKKMADLDKARTEQIEAKEKALKTEKGKEADLQKEIDSLKSLLKDAAAEKTRLEATLKKLDVQTLRQEWEEKEAYAADAYRMLTSRKLCLQCHQVGSFTPSEKVKVGPPLALASQRLRPGWVVQWVNQPQRYVPYSSLMPSYFSEKEPKWQPIHSGPALEQLHALRDVLMNFPRVADMPINRHYNPDLPADKK